MPATRTGSDTDDEPIRGELFSVERLEGYAECLAAQHRVTEARDRRRPLLHRLEQNARELQAAYSVFANSIREESAVSPAAAWLVDNFHIVEQQLREIRQDLPPSYYYELPKLAEGEIAGYPRIYGIALALIAHTDSRLDIDKIKRFVLAYQRKTTLTIGELWAIAITLRLALVENLRRLSRRISKARDQRGRADALADLVNRAVAERATHQVVSYLDEQLPKRGKLSTAFVAQLAQRLRGIESAAGVVLDWLNTRLAQEGESTEQVLQVEHQQQAASQITVENVITSMRLLSTLDWQDFFERVCPIEPILGDDPARAYSLMDFETRDRYRHVIERISKRVKAVEVDVARQAVQLARLAHENNPEDQARAHVGYYLIEDGRAQLERAFGYKPTLVERSGRLLARRSTLVYIGAFSLFTTVLVLLPVLWALYSGAGPGTLAGLVLLSIVPASDVALSLLNLAITSIRTPRKLSKIDVSSGIPETARTMVVVPTLLTDTEVVQELFERLEVCYLANQDHHLHFALLSDFGDAPQETMPDDESVLEAACRRVAELNATYQREGQDKPFYLFHRRRKLNPAEAKWMGWERKRGKLHEFNRLLRGAQDTSFTVSTCEPALLSKIRYVITLDSDTRLPRDAARRLVGTTLHPLNHARFDPMLGRVTAGYGILQPRVSISPECAGRSLFSRVWSGNIGIDPYTTAVSDVYQDLFDEGIYTGKGLYDVDAFEAALASRVPENSLLSHDLFEGLFARTALVSDIEVFDEYPERYDSYARRQHRWTRGDWQIAGWTLPRVPGEAGHRVLNVLPLISRWKIVDNLRRSLVAPSAMLWLIFAWVILPPPALLWVSLILLMLAFPIFAHVTSAILIRHRISSWTSHFLTIFEEIGTNVSRVALTIAFLPHQAHLMADAIVRTLYRTQISRRNLLEWVTAAQDGRTSRGNRNGPLALLRFMLLAEVNAFGALAIVLLFRPDALPVTALFLLLWVCSPLVAYWVSLDTPREREYLDDRDISTARLVARRTWRYFETFVGEGDHWLPPDNYQDDPEPLVAHRTSPTNVGLLLLATAAARDFGYIGTLEMVERLELTFATFEKLPRYRGHFFNWYDTHTLEALNPQYISTVDSGNLAGHILGVKQACIEVADRPLFDARVIAGLADTLSALNDEAQLLSATQQRTPGLSRGDLSREIDACFSLLAVDPPGEVSGWIALVDSLASHLRIIEDIATALAHEHGEQNFIELRFWTGALIHQTSVYRRDLLILTLWAGKPAKEISILLEKFSQEAREQWQTIEKDFDRVPAPSQVQDQCDAALVRLAVLCDLVRSESRPDSDPLLERLRALAGILEETAERAKNLLERFGSLERLCCRFIDEMDFHFLFDEERKVLTIGYNVTDRRRDDSFYDLLASEARLASFIAIATGDVPQEHWFRLGRQLTALNGKRALIAWSGTMFEYLMPLLVMRSYQGTLLDQTHRTAVERQIEYGEECGVPWGVSESGYNARDLQFNYQYGPFGVPGMGFKRGLADDLVVAPYATLLAAMIRPRAALSNLRRLIKSGALGPCGFYEAIDYTSERLPEGHRQIVVRALMTHHQGMSLVALDNLLHDNIMQNRFHRDALVQATELLLQERIPRLAPTIQPRAPEGGVHRLIESSTASAGRRYTSPDFPTPRTQLLSNGIYTVMITTAGAGYSKCGHLAVTRWREDPTRDHWGSFCYLRDVRSGAIWSAGYQPTARTPQSYEVILSEHKVDIRRTDVGVVTHTEVIVSPEDNAELRRISLTNQSSREREIEVTSYAEIVLAPNAKDIAHSAFSNLSIETEFVAAENTLLAHRRQHSNEGDAVWGVHTMVTDRETGGGVQYETNRGRFVGRGNTPRSPIAVTEDRRLSNTVGAVLDPIFSLRARVRLQPNETARVTLTTAVAHSRDEALRIADKYHDPGMFEREAGLAWTKSQVEMRHLNIDADEANVFQRIAGRLLYLDPLLRPHPQSLALNTRTQENLWPYGLGGDLPILLVRINNQRDLETVRRVLLGHEYLRMKGVAVDLVILSDHPPSYSQTLQDEIQNLVRKSRSFALVDKSGGVHLRRTDIMPEADRILLETAARVCIFTERGSLEENLSLQSTEAALPGPFIARTSPHRYAELRFSTPALAFFNGLGGFGPSGREYVIVLGEDQWTPAPWLNVISNEREFGFQVSETGAGYTWSINSGENRLTPWSNDPVSDSPGEVIYLRDEDAGAVWTPTALPIRESSPYVVKHGQGYTTFEHASHGISQELVLFVPRDAPVKISLLRLHNQTDQKRSISVTDYTELVLGKQRERNAPFTITEIDQATGAIFARNPYNNEFAQRIAFMHMNVEAVTLTCDRTEFIGRNGSLTRPAALNRTKLSGRVGAGLDPCMALQTTIELAPDESKEIVILLGQAESVEEARAIISRYEQYSAVTEAFEHVRAYWDELLETVQIDTPDPAINTLANRWLLYQTLACRMWARSAFYQSSGAYGFRDQLQDCLALVYTRPELARQQILRSAARQFREGDVQHWWHPPTGRGVRTRCSDDLAWLPYSLACYISATGDAALLDEQVHFLDAPRLPPDQDEQYLHPTVSGETASLYEHCVRALDRSITVGSHGLPLMGAGDWNDGMNLVGREGKGESVWLGWFLYATLKAFAPICDSRDQKERSAAYRVHMEQLRKALEEFGWDGNWYRRAYFDDGTPLGSGENQECRIDSISQSWAVISGAADPHRAARAMASVEEYLIRRGDGLILLLTPPFDRMSNDPGYIKSYVPGVRENGGQYTHAALWLLMAYAELGDGDRAGEMLALLNPINHASSRAGIHRYKVEPYVVAADVYSAPPHSGRGGWTWYTGSAAWMYRAILESMLGFKLCGNRIEIKPCVPRSWTEYRVTYRRGSTSYQFQVENPHGVCSGVASVEVDGKKQSSAEIPISDDGKIHLIRVILGGKPDLPNDITQAAIATSVPAKL